MAIYWTNAAQQQAAHYVPPQQLQAFTNYVAQQILQDQALQQNWQNYTYRPRRLNVYQAQWPEAFQAYVTAQNNGSDFLVTQVRTYEEGHPDHNDRESEGEG